MKDDHIGPVNGLNFMSLNMTDDELEWVQSGIITIEGNRTPENALAVICREWLLWNRIQKWLDCEEGRTLELFTVGSGDDGPSHRMKYSANCHSPKMVEGECDREGVFGVIKGVTG